MLTEYERKEIQSFSHIYYWGQHVSMKRGGALSETDNNYGLLFQLLILSLRLLHFPPFL